MSKDLKEKAISIKGKDYVLVSDRVIYFNEQYPNGSITTELISDPTADRVIVKAIVLPDIDKPERKFSDYSQALWGDGFINKASAIENCSTSAVGRALSYMGIGVIDSIASVDEINKAQSTTGYDTGASYTTNAPATAAQATLLLQKAKEYSGLDTKEAVLNWFFEKTGMQLGQVKKIEVDNVLKFLEEERDV